MNTIYLIRHGKTQANIHKWYCGSTDVSLCDTGIAELKQMHYTIKNVRFITSGMKRTEETLHLLFGDVAFDREPDFREIDFGEFEMHGYEELKDRADYQAWITGDHEANIPPHGESGIQMKERVLKALSKVMETEKDTVIITHGGVIAAIMAHCFPEENKNRYQWQPRQGHGYAIQDKSYTVLP